MLGGPEVRGMVAAMIEDPETEPYERRKAEQRLRITREDRVVGAVYAAESLVGVRSLAASEKGAAAGASSLPAHRSDAGPGLSGSSLSRQLQFELDALIQRSRRPIAR